MINIGQVVPNFNAQTEENQHFNLQEYLKQGPVVLYFYPKDDTPGCTIEAKDFDMLSDQFKRLGYRIIGVSRDDVGSHNKFKCKYALNNITLLADIDQKICNIFNVLVEKNMYGKKVIGISRSTFIIDAECKLLHEWRGIKAENHAHTVLTWLNGNI